ncbi:hypothetical protein [Fulvivirga lutea]|uniref:Uncharacterized protein n=1 Tax=Fulvivirga lutea TaxID=2810512 RepID=A0A974WGL8_9BACT|nr:hypothetical protein [Fulvivirga lutea]QSE96722.1 hypothetical protein JR347_14120 [Fulvivirga lutea]
MMQDVIFLIDSEYFDKNILGMTLEKHTRCKVFNFFSFEETLLYKNLRPSLIVHDNGIVDPTYFDSHVSFYDISNNKESLEPKDPSEVILELAGKVKDYLKAS